MRGPRLQIFRQQRPQDTPEPAHTVPDASSSNGKGWNRPPSGDTMVLTIFFDDIKGSTALKESMVGSQSEQAFHTLRHEHDELMEEIICRDGGGQIVKSTGDGVLAVFLSPSVAVQAAME